MNDNPRLRQLNDDDLADGDFVLYWMQASERTQYNYALEYAIEQANELKLPLLVCFGLMDDYPEANARHYLFMLQGLRDVHANLEKRGVRFVVKHGQPFDAAIHYGKNAALIVCDRGYTRHQKMWRERVAHHAGKRVVEIESDVVVPVNVASDKREYAARTIRPKIHKHWKQFLSPIKHAKVRVDSLSLKVVGDIDVTDPEAALKKLKVDRSVKPVDAFIGGENPAQRALRDFVAHRLDNYDEARNEPASANTSRMSAHLHFGHISPVELALAVLDSGKGSKEDRDSYVEELIVRRELAMNFVNFTSDYDQYECLPEWARKTLAAHARDKRPYVYTAAELEAAETHDPYWNAAQREMNKTGFMHNYMRMYWGKKVLEWSRSPKQAHETLLHLNNKLFLCGRDPNAFANVGWIFGLHDRPWGPARPIFGTVRYMNSAGLDRKFDMDAYVKRIAAL